MSTKPIFVATHPRACSTAFERVFMTRRDTLKCIHEPFGDAFYYGPERLSERYEKDAQARIDSGFSQSTFQTVLDRLEKDGAEGKRLLIKDIGHYLFPPDQKPVSIAPSVLFNRRGVGTATNGVTDGDASHTDATDSAVDPSAPPLYPYATSPEADGNPTVLPLDVLKQFHWTFLIRHPRSSVPSYYRCTIPPLCDTTGFYNYMPSEAGYDEVRRLLTYLMDVGEIGPRISGQSHTSGATTDEGKAKGVDICLVDADDLLDSPKGIIKAFCDSTGLDYDPRMLKWDSQEDAAQAKEAFEKWNGFHDDAMNSTELKPRVHKSHANKDLDEEWRTKYGEDGAKLIRETVDQNLEDYEFLKKFALKPAQV